MKGSLPPFLGKLNLVPELPEVETIARGLARRVTGDVIESVWLGSKPEPFKSSASEIVATLEDTRIAGVWRMGKHIVFDLQKLGVRKLQKKSKAKLLPAPKARGPGRASRAQWIVHLGMTGRMRLSSPDQEIEKHTHAIAKLASGRELRFVDARRFGRLSVSRHGSFEAGGSEPLDINLDEFIRLFRERKTPIKAALLNQKLLRGIGNIYADESLFRAGIRPRRRASTLARERLERLYRSVQEVLQEAIRTGGSSIRDYVDADGEEGFFQWQHRVYGREGEPCLICHRAIKRVVIGGRSSHYCPNCQK